MKWNKNVDKLKLDRLSLLFSPYSHSEDDYFWPKAVRRARLKVVLLGRRDSDECGVEVGVGASAVDAA